MRSTFRAFALVGLAVAGLSSPGFGQDPKTDDGKPVAPSAPPAPAAKKDAAQLLQEMEALYPVAIRRPTTNGQPGDQKAVAEQAAVVGRWEDAVNRLSKTSDEYLAALGGAAPDARALFLRGVGKTIAGERVGAGEAKNTYAAACDSLQRWLDAADEKDASRADAEAYFAKALVHSLRMDDAVVHGKNAVAALQKESRHDDAGECAWIVFVGLQGAGRSKDLREFADAIHAKDGDFGVSTPTIRKLLAASRVAVGSPLPEIPAVTDLDDKPISFAAEGKPLLLHFFFTAIPGIGDARATDDLDKQIRPLWDRFHEKGLRIVGICMDNAMTREKSEAMRKQREEWGTKGDFLDGTPDSCRAWVKKHGVEWTVRCSGKWIGEPVSQALGGVGESNPAAILVDKDGIVRWAGDLAKPEGLADEAEKACR